MAIKKTAATRILWIICDYGSRQLPRGRQSSSTIRDNYHEGSSSTTIWENYHIELSLRSFNENSTKRTMKLIQRNRQTPGCLRTSHHIRNHLILRWKSGTRSEAGACISPPKRGGVFARAAESRSQQGLHHGVGVPQKPSVH